MKKIITIICLFIVCTTQVFAISTSKKDDYKEKVLNYINEYRKELSIPYFKYNENLQLSAQNHSEYMAKYDVFTHEQNKEKDLFTGVYPWDRIAYYKYPKPYVLELINKDSKNYKDAFINLFKNPYNRVALLNPIYTDIGMGNKDNKYTFHIGGKNITKEYEITYPLINQKNVPLIYYENNNGISAYRNYDNRKPKYSIIISYSYFTPKQIKQIKIDKTKVKLLNKNKNSYVPIEVNTPKNDEYLTNSILIIPLRKLEPDTEYEVSIQNIYIKYADDIYVNKKSKKWSFTTANINQYDKLQETVELEKKITRKQFAELIVMDSNIKINDKIQNEFDDVDKNSVYAKYIYALRDLNIIYGNGNNNFNPQNYITREQAVVIIMRMYNYLLNKDYKDEDITATEKIFNDIYICSPWAKKAVYVAYKLGFIKGRQNNKFDPKTNITYEEAKLLMDRLSNYIFSAKKSYLY